MSGILLAAHPVRAAVDLTGRWYALSSDFYFGQDRPSELDMVQSGTTLTVAYRGQPRPWATGTIDPETGVFDLVAENTLANFCLGSPPLGSLRGTASSSDEFTATRLMWTGEFTPCFPLSSSIRAKRSQCGLTGEVCEGGPLNFMNFNARCCAPTCDAFLPVGATCRLDQNACTRDMCDGAGSCIGPPADAGTECRPARILCDVAEHCDGIATECPADEFLPAGTLCPGERGTACGNYVCAAEGGCIFDPLPAGNLCRPAFNECSIEQYCDADGHCPIGVPRPLGTPCVADADPCTLDQCNGRFSCEHPPAPDGTECDDGNPRTGNDRCLAGVCAGMAETRLVRDIRPGPDSSSPAAFIGVGDVLFFVADDGEHGRELWRSDGTSSGTRMVIDLNPGPADAFRLPEPLVARDATLLFGADDGRGGAQLWRSDGTEHGTVLLKDVAPGESSWPIRHLIALGDGSVAFMVATDFELHNQGVEGTDRLWASDGTEDGTVAVADLGFLKPGSFGEIGEIQEVEQLFSFDDGLLAGVVNRSECCATASLMRVEADGATQTAFRRPPRYGHQMRLNAPSNLTALDNAVVFFTMDGYGPDCELFRTDGTLSGTRPVNLPGMACGLRNLVSDGDSLIFTRNESVGTAFWRVSSSGEDPALIVVAGLQVSHVTQAGSRLFFVTDTGNGSELWKSDGTQSGTMEVRDLNLGPAGSNPTALTIVDGRLLFAADDGVAGPSLWTSDGTADGTIRVGRLPSDHTQLFSPFVTAGNDVFFYAHDEAHGAELWALPRLALEGSCVADCDASGTVNVDELIVSVNVALGSAPLSRCTSADFDGNGQVTVDELVAAVNRALEGCA